MGMQRHMTGFVRCLSDQRGVSLIAMSFLLVGLGLFSLPAIQLYKAQNTMSAKVETDDKIAHIQRAMAYYLSHNGRYPCPAPLNEAIDSQRFGREAATDCRSVAMAGTERALGRDNRWVRTGTIPTRTLGIPDSYMIDGYGQRLIYAVTEEYAVQGTVAARDSGAIQILDGSGNNATSEPGNVVQVVYSMGGDMNGAYSADGVRLQNCNAAARSGENCDFSTNAVFMNTLQKSRSQDVQNAFTHTISYVPNKDDVLPCDEAAGANMPKDTAFLVDTSGSMFDPAKCPAGMGNKCTRIDVAHWAMRRIVPARMHNNENTDEPGGTGMTGFQCTSSTNCTTMVRDDKFTYELFDDPSSGGYTAPDEDTVNAKLEAQLKTMCPPSASASTPLGLHLEELAEKIRGSKNSNRPNKITVISDGLSNVGKNPVDVAKSIVKAYPNLQIDIIDVTGNTSLREISDVTGGKYYRSDNPDELLKALYSSAGVCNGGGYTPKVPADTNYCSPPRR